MKPDGIIELEKTTLSEGNYCPSVLDVYIAEIPDVGIDAVDIIPPSRKSEIESVKNASVKRQKYYVWKLLQYALDHSFGYKMSDMSFERRENGKWTSPCCFFSLSHTDTLAVAAVSDSEVGVDIENVSHRFRSRMEEKILTGGERAELSNIETEEQRSEYLIRKWTVLESVFKFSGESPLPVNENQCFPDTESVLLELCGEKYYLSATSKCLDKMRIFDNIALVT